MRLPIGVSNFRKLITHTDLSGNHYLFVDKSLFIRDILNNLSEVTLITRPRRFGKTLSMSMLHHFLASEVDGEPTKGLFANLEVAKHPECMRHQGQYPVIYLTFKDIKSKSFTEAYADICKLIGKIYAIHAHILISDKLTEFQKEQYNLIIKEQASITNLKAALQDLIFYLHKSSGVKPIVLIDEYDTPIQSAYMHGYYVEMVDFMRDFLGKGLKDNSSLHISVLTGILRIAKESLFSGLNNLDNYSLLDNTYGEYFGFTEQEVSILLAKTNLSTNLGDVKAWYNGYQCGQTVVYNPWSIINYLNRDGELKSYWVNTSDNSLIKQILLKSNIAIKEQFTCLLQDHTISVAINEHFIFSNLETNETAIWTLFLMAGYLKVTSLRHTDFGPLYAVELPNKEVTVLFKLIITEWLSGVDSTSVFNKFLHDFLSGNMLDFTDKLHTIMLQTFSVYDTTGKEPEKFYHGFMLGLIAGIDPTQYVVSSNKESGLGRYDIALMPSDVNKLGIILELKSIDKADLSLLQEKANHALQQIDNKQYIAAMLRRNIKQCLKIGIAFSGKELAVAHKIDVIKNLRY